jgi:hypothetical protein
LNRLHPILNERKSPDFIISGFSPGIEWLVSSARKAERMISMESDIKIGQQFEFAMHADNGPKQKAVVTRVLSNRKEGLGPEVDYYMADWIEARTLSEPPKALLFVLANDGNVYLDGQRVDIIVDLAA